MKLFLDSADVEAVKDLAELGVVDGVTTNPTLVAKARRPYDEVVKEICNIVDGPVSAETVETEAKKMIADAKRLAALAANVVVKIPLTAEGLKAVKALADLDIKTNVTLCFSATQGWLAAKAGASYISPFVGRLDDIGHDGMQLISDLVVMYENYGYETEVLAASIRHPLHVIDAAKAGADVATIPPAVVYKLLQHPLTDKGVALFEQDYAKIKS